MENIIQPVFIDNMINIGDKKVDVTKLTRIAVEFKRIAADNNSEPKEVL